MNNIETLNFNGKDTIAFMTRGIDYSSGLDIWKGIVSECKKNNINLITFIGDQLDGNQSNIVYELISSKIIKGIISWASSDADKYVKFYDLFKGIPVITLTLKIKGFPVIAVNSYQGMIEAVNHLIKDHNLRKIAFVRGPETHVAARERFQAYRDALKENDIEIDDNIITPPVSFHTESGITATKLFLDERRLKPKVDIEAIMSVSDVITLGVLNELENRNIKVPEDITLVGYNFTHEARCSKPAITSVEMPFIKQGELGVQTLLNMIKGNKVEDEIKIDSHLKILNSCGCEFYSVQNAAVNKNIFNSGDCNKNIFTSKKIFFKNKKKNETLEEIKNKINDQILKNISSNIEYFLLPENTIKGFIEKISVSLFDEINNNTEEAYLNCFKIILYDIFQKNGNINSWNHVVTAFKIVLPPYLNDLNKQIHALNILDQSRVLIGEIANQLSLYNSMQVEKHFNNMVLFGSKMTNVYNYEDIRKNMSAFLPKMGIKEYYIVLYEKPEPYVFMKKTPLWANLEIAFFNNKDNILTNEEKRFESENILPAYVLKKISLLNFCILPIHLEQNQFGYVIIQNGPFERNVYSFLKDQLGSVFYKLSIFKELEKTKEDLQKTIDLLHNKVQVISSNSSHVSIRVNDVSTALGEAAENIVEISKNINEVMNTVNNAVEISNNVNKLIIKLSLHSQKIDDISKVISDIAQQTNILSINASIEASRTGDAGKGFAIVAKEIKTLSKKTVVSTQEINDMIKLIQNSSKDTIESITKVIEVIQTISILSKGITEAINEQSSVTTQVSKLLTEAASGSNEISRAITDLAQMDQN